MSDSVVALDMSEPASVSTAGNDDSSDEEEGQVVTHREALATAGRSSFMWAVAKHASSSTTTITSPVTPLHLTGALIDDDNDVSARHEKEEEEDTYDYETAGQPSIVIPPASPPPETSSMRQRNVTPSPNEKTASHSVPSIISQTKKVTQSFVESLVSEDSMHKRMFNTRAELCQTMIAGLIVIAWISAMLYMLYLSTGVLRTKGWRPCANLSIHDSPTDASFMSQLRYINRQVAHQQEAMCSTSGPPYQDMPCYCCASSNDCFQFARIVSNSTGQAKVKDSFRGVIYQRNIPIYMDVCYIRDFATQEECATISGVHVSHILRALELLHGWPPAGTVVG